MSRPPRDPLKDKLVTSQIFTLAYLQIGLIQALAGFFAYFWVMAENGFDPFRLYQLRQEWDSRGVTNLVDSYGQEWVYYFIKIFGHFLNKKMSKNIILTDILTY